MKRWNLGTSFSFKTLVLGLWMVVAALGFRLVARSAPQKPLAGIPAVQTVQLSQEYISPQSVRAETASQVVSEPEKPPDPAPEEPARLTFAVQEADAIAIGGSAESAVDKASLLLAPVGLSGDAQVLIVHTHTSEAYTPEPGREYDATEPYRTQDPDYNVVCVGEALAEELEAQGIGVIHDTTVNDFPVYEGAYERSYDVIAARLAAHPSIQIVLDIHRDAAEDREGNALAQRAEVDGEDCARLMLVVGTDEGGLEHPDWRENLSFALKLQALLNRSCPGLCRDISLRRERYNQQFTPCSLLVEVGAAGNTLSEALTSARCLARAIAEMLRGLSP